MTNETPNQGSSFKDWVRHVWDEGLARHVVIEKTAVNKQAINLPLTFVLVGGVLAPWLLAAGLVIAVLRGYSIRIQGGGGEPAPTDAVKKAAADASEKAQSLLGDAVDKTTDLAGKAVDRAKNMGGDSDDASQDVAEKAQSVLDEAVDETADLAGEAVDHAEEAGEAIAEAAREAAEDFEARLPEGESRP